MLLLQWHQGVIAHRSKLLSRLNLCQGLGCLHMGRVEVEADFIIGHSASSTTAWVHADLALLLAQDMPYFDMCGRLQLLVAVLLAHGPIDALSPAGLILIITVYRQHSACPPSRTRHRLPLFYWTCQACSYLFPSTYET